MCGEIPGQQGLRKLGPGVVGELLLNRKTLSRAGEGCRELELDLKVADRVSNGQETGHDPTSSDVTMSSL